MEEPSLLPLVGHGRALEGLKALHLHPLAGE